jgi:hypothetical protein
MNANAVSQSILATNLGSISAMGLTALLATLARSGALMTA